MDDQLIHPRDLAVDLIAKDFASSTLRSRMRDLRGFSLERR
jgi:hypothetical protein